MVGPDSATCLVLASALLYLGVTSPDERVTVAAALALMTGGLCILSGLLRLGFLADFLSRPVLTGFLSGIAVDLIIGQISRLTGITIGAKGLIRPIVELATKLDERHPVTTALGLGLLVLLRVMRRVTPQVPAPLLAILVGMGLGAAFDLQGHSSISSHSARPKTNTPRARIARKQPFMRPSGSEISSITVPAARAAATPEAVAWTMRPRRFFTTAPPICRKVVGARCRQASRLSPALMRSPGAVHTPAGGATRRPASLPVGNGRGRGPAIWRRRNE